MLIWGLGVGFCFSIRQGGGSHIYVFEKDRLRIQVAVPTASSTIPWAVRTAILMTPVKPPGAELQCECGTARSNITAHAGVAQHVLSYLRAVSLSSSGLWVSLNPKPLNS